MCSQQAYAPAPLRGCRTHLSKGQVLQAGEGGQVRHAAVGQPPAAHLQAAQAPQLAGYKVRGGACAWRV